MPIVSPAQTKMLSSASIVRLVRQSSPIPNEVTNRNAQFADGLSAAEPSIPSLNTDDDSVALAAVFLDSIQSRGAKIVLPSNLEWHDVCNNLRASSSHEAAAVVEAFHTSTHTWFPISIGRILLERFLSRRNTTVVAASRSPDSASSKQLLDLPRGKDSHIVLCRIDNTDENSGASAISDLVAATNIPRLDIVIANAGISAYFGKATETPAGQMTDHFSVNTTGSLLLFQATASLLSLAERPKFIAISSGAGSIGGMEALKDVQNTAYGASKAALNFVVRKIHFENPGLIAFCVNPGWLQTDLGNHAAVSAGMSQAPVPVEDGVQGILHLIDDATRENTSGRFLGSDGKAVAW
ncbi:hypothetical protein MBLNU13_g08084t1 [Cladosporium sp. NU13]